MPVNNDYYAAGGGAEETWRLEGVGAPHDIAVTASPMPVRGTGDRALALFVAETKPSDSWLRKYLFVPPGRCIPPACPETLKHALHCCNVYVSVRYSICMLVTCQAFFA